MVAYIFAFCTANVSLLPWPQVDLSHRRLQNKRQQATFFGSDVVALCCISISIAVPSFQMIVERLVLILNLADH